MCCGSVMDAHLEGASFDAVFVQAAIHHFYDIEEHFALFHHVLKPDGIVIYDEYVGPDHHMYEPEVMDLLDEIDSCLAPQYRWDVARKSVRNEINGATLDWMLETDPSEGVHSSKILPLTYKYFDVIHRIDYGGTVMRPFFSGILPNFDFGDTKDQTVARLIIKIEELLIREGKIPSYHSQIVGRRLDVPRGDLSPEECERINYSNWAGFGKFSKATPPHVTQYTPVNYSDENWKNGIGVFGGAIVLLQNSRKSLSDLVVGRSCIFHDKSKRQILDVKRDDSSVIVTFSGVDLDPEATGYPNYFMVYLDQATGGA